MDAVVKLPDGRGVAVRPVVAADADAEQAFVRALSPAARLLRFHIGIRELSAELLHTMTHVDQRCHVAFVAEHVAADGTRRIVADARYVRDACGGDAEFAIAVADEWQGVGLGHALLTRLVRHARRAGVARLSGDIVHDNAPMVGLLRKLGGRVRRHPGDARLLLGELALA